MQFGDSAQYNPHETGQDLNFTLLDIVLSPTNATLGQEFPGGLRFNGSGMTGPASLGDGAEVRIALYSLIFFLSVVGNTLVIVTLIQNRRMRTVTNVFLLNLSISDLLLAVFCMPFTLIPTLLKNFIFGKAMCVLIRYMQGVSVGVSAFTLVAISLERYFAICQPLRSRSWQTLSHAYKIIILAWFISFVIMIPIAVFQKLLKMGYGNKCQEVWVDTVGEKAYAVFLDYVLLVLPLMLLLLGYGKIVHTLWQGIRMEMKSAQEMTELRQCHDDDVDTDDETRYDNGSVATDKRRSVAGSNGLTGTPSRRRTQIRQHIRQNNTERSLQAKKRVIRMLFIVVVEYFVCWTPTYILQTWIVFDYFSAVSHVSPMAMNFIHLLSYASSCCNPITYCFLNRKFRQGFLSAFRCCPCVKRMRRVDQSFAGTSQRTVFTSLRLTSTYTDACTELQKASFA